MLITGQPIEAAIGPPSFHACPKVVKQPLRMQMMVSEIAKLENPLQPRFSSCLYPRAASRSSSVEPVLELLLIRPPRALVP